MNQPEYVPQTPREIMETHRRLLKSRVEKIDMVQASLIPAWTAGDAPGAEWIEYAQMGDYTLYAAKTAAALHSTAPKGAARISWNVTSSKADDVVAGGGAMSIAEAKDYAYLVYQAAFGYIKGGDA